MFRRNFHYKDQRINISVIVINCFFKYQTCCATHSNTQIVYKLIIWFDYKLITSIMLTSSANQYLRPEYLSPLPTTVSSFHLFIQILDSPQLKLKYNLFSYKILYISKLIRGSNWVKFSKIFNQRPAYLSLD